MVPPFLHGEALESYEALAIQEFVAHGLEKTREARKMVVVLLLVRFRCRHDYLEKQPLISLSKESQHP